MFWRALRFVKKTVFGIIPLPPGIRIGSNVYIGDATRLDWDHGRHITLEDNVTLATGVRVLCHDASSRRRIGATWVAPVTIKSGTFIGSESVLLPGITIGPDSIVASGAVVTRDVPPGQIVAGVPARVIGTVSDLDAKRLRQLSERPVFSSVECEGDKPTPELATQLVAAAQDGGYFLR